MKKLVSILASVCVSASLFAPAAYAKDDDGKIDLYEVFSNKKDILKTDVGSRIYKWSMHLPDDAIIYKSDRVNYFNMSTTSYQSSVQLEVNKNKDELSLEDVLYQMQNNSDREDFGEWGDKEFAVDIAEDESGQRYIRIIKSSKGYDYFMVDEAAEELRDYIENRIYVTNNYIYNLTISMNGEFYKQHDEMFDKLSSSFKLSFDEKNPYIKELSDSVSTTREYKNTSYGWKLVMSPYWKVEGTPNARNQSFRPVYSDEELNESKKIGEDNKEEFKIPEGITVNLISSAENSETSVKWAEKEINKLKDNYHNEAYEILKNEERTQGNTKVQHVVIRYKTVTKNPYIIHNVYVVGNGYKYLVTATMMEDKYKDNSKRSSFENMLNSFTLEKDYFSQYLGKFISAESLINLNASKELKMKKYNFNTKVTKSWNTFGDGFGFDDELYNDEFFHKYGEQIYRENISNNEYVNAFESSSNMRVDMFAGLNTSKIKEIIQGKAEGYLNNDEIRMGLAKVKIESSEYNGAEVYYLEKEYDLDAVKKFVNEDETKIYDLKGLENEYTHIIKIGQDTYTQTITLPVANMTSKNKTKVNEIWRNTSINKTNYSKLNLKWQQHKLEDFDKEKK